MTKNQLKKLLDDHAKRTGEKTPRAFVRRIVADLNNLYANLDSSRYDRGDRAWRKYTLTSYERAEVEHATKRVRKAIRRWKVR